MARKGDPKRWKPTTAQTDPAADGAGSTKQSPRSADDAGRGDSASAALSPELLAGAVRGLADPNLAAGRELKASDFHLLDPDKARKFQEAEHKRAKQKADDEHKRCEQTLDSAARRDREAKVLSLTLWTTGAIMALCVYRLARFPYEQSPWAPPLLTLIVGGLTGFITGKTSASASATRE